MKAEAKERRLKRLSGGKATPGYLESMTPYERKKLLEENEGQRKHMAEPGTLGLAPLLEERRLEYNIPDHAFDAHASFGFVLVYQITRVVGETYGESQILMTESARDKETKEAPRGVVVSAGLDALDKLRSNGLDLGHIVMFSRSMPYRASMGFVGTKEQKLIVLHVGDIFASEDLATAMFDGEARVAVSEDAETGFNYHHYQDRDGFVWKPHAAKKTASV